MVVWSRLTFPLFLIDAIYSLQVMFWFEAKGADRANEYPPALSSTHSGTRRWMFFCFLIKKKKWTDIRKYQSVIWCFQSVLGQRTHNVWEWIKGCHSPSGEYTPFSFSLCLLAHPYQGHHFQGCLLKPCRDRPMGSTHGRRPGWRKIKDERLLVSSYTFCCVIVEIGLSRFKGACAHQEFHSA